MKNPGLASDSPALLPSTVEKEIRFHG